MGFFEEAGGVLVLEFLTGHEAEVAYKGALSIR